MANITVEQLYKDYKELEKYLIEAKQPTFVTYAGDNFKKVLIIAAASHFDLEVRNLLIDFSINYSKKEELNHFVRNRAIERQFHALFDWKKRQCYTFLSFFGTKFKDECKKEIEKDGTLNDAMVSFLELGDIRNNLAHEDFITIELSDKSMEDCYRLYEQATFFVNFLRKKLL